MRCRIHSQESWTLAWRLHAWRVPARYIWRPSQWHTLQAMPLPTRQPWKPVRQNLLTRTRRISLLWLLPRVRHIYNLKRNFSVNSKDADVFCFWQLLKASYVSNIRIILLFTVTKANTARFAHRAMKATRWSPAIHADRYHATTATPPAPEWSGPRMSVYARITSRDATAISARMIRSTCPLTSGKCYISRYINSKIKEGRVRCSFSNK